MALVQYPVHGQTDVYINRQLVYIFPKAVKESSLYSGSVVLYDARDHHIVDGVLSYDPDSFAVQFLPAQELTRNTSYTWALTGEDDNSALPIEFEDSTRLTTSIWIDFQTGTKRVGEQNYTSGVPGNTEPWDRIIEDGQTIEQYAADTFKVISSAPVHMGSFVNVLTDVITIKFSRPLKTGQDWDELISMSYSPVHRETYYFNNDKFKTHIIDKIPGKTTYLENAETFLMPEGTWEIVGTDTLRWSKTLGQPNFNANAYVNVMLSKDILSSTDEKLNALNDEHLYFMTQLFPIYTNPEAILLRISTIASVIHEDSLLKHILLNSITAARIANVTNVEELAVPNRYAQQFVECATIVGLIDSRALDVWMLINAGKTITLGDLQLTNNSLPVKDMTPMLRDECAKCMDDARNALLFISGNRDFWVGERGRNVPVEATYGKYRKQVPHSYGIYPGYTGVNAQGGSGYLGYTGYLGRGGILTGGVFI